MRCRLLLTVLSTIFFCAPFVVAQEGEEKAQEKPAEEQKPAQPPYEREGYGSPRECMKAFLAAAHAYRYEDGGDEARAQLLRALDLGTWSDGDWKAIGLERGLILYETINHTAYVDLDSLVGPLEGSYLTRDSWVASPEGHPDIEIRVELRRPRDGDLWTITSETLERAYDMWEKVRGLPLVDEAVEELPFLERQRERLRSILPDGLLAVGFVLENWQWVALLVLIALGVVLDRIVRFLVSRLVVRLARSEALEIDKGSLKNLDRPFGLFVIALTFGGLLPLVGVEPNIHKVLDVAASFVMTVAGIWAAIRMVDVLSDFLRAKARRTENKFDDMLVPLLRKTLKILVSVVGLVFIASRLTTEIWGILAGLSIGSLAVGFAAKDSIENLFGTFTVLMDKPFQLGDWIIFGSVEGTVERVGFRSTRVRTFYNSLISVPNSKFIAAEVDNMGSRRYRRIKATLGLTYDTPAEKIEAFCEGVRQLIRIHPYTRKDSYHVYFNGFGASSLDVLLYCFLECPDWGTELREKQRLFADILRLAGKLGVSFAFPTQTVHLAKPEDLEHPDAPKTWREGEDLGRKLADAIAAESLAPFGENKPKPVVVQQKPVRSE